MLSRIISSKGSSVINKAEKLNLIDSHGICPLCGTRLIDENNGYIGKNYIFPNDHLITTCPRCNHSLSSKKISFDKVNDYLVVIEKEINKIWNRR